MRGLQNFQLFQRTVQQFAGDASPNRHFGELLKAATSQSDDKRVKATFSVSESDSKSFLARLLIDGKGWRAGMITAIEFNQHSLVITIYEPCRNVLTIPIGELAQFFIEQQPRDGTKFVIRNEKLVKVDTNEQFNPEGDRRGARTILTSPVESVQTQA